MLNKFRPQQTPSGELQPYRDLRDVDMSNWGTPEVDETSASLSQDGLLGNDGFRPIRGQVPKWAPGEFEQWKQAKMLHMPTQYGWNKQRAFNERPLMQGHVRQLNPALLALMNGLK